MENGIYAKFNTPKGAILVKLTHDLTPGTVGNFVALAEGNLENKADVTFTMNEVATSAFGFASTEEIRVYPNPATEYFSVDGLDRLKEVIVYNLVGQEVKRFNASLKAKYDISELMRGLYLVRLVDQSEKVVKTVRLSKR